jgi:TolB-like protein
MPAVCAGGSAFMESFGDYTILDRMHVGTLGELVRARDVRLGRTVALRLVSPAVCDDRERREALLADAQAAATLSHPHIAALFDFGEEQGRVFLAHEFVPGQPLRAHLTGKPIEVGLALEFAVQLADAVAEGHRQGVVHANLCPSSIFITPTDQTKIVGFGLSAWTSGGTERKAIADQLAVGQDPSTAGANTIVPYMAPEQLLAGRADPRADVFSLGVVIYEMLTGRPAFGSDTAGATAVKVLYGTPPLASGRNKAVPQGFDAILTKAMAKSLDARYPSAAAMVADLRALAGELHVRVTAEVSRGTTEAAVRKRRPALKRAAIAGLVLVAAGVLGGAAWTLRSRVAAIFRSSVTVSRPILLVMPFQMAASEPDKDYYGAGFAEDLAARLGEVQGLTVVGRSTSAGPATPSLSDRAARVGAVVALRGTVRPGPSSLGVDAELVEVATDRVLWSEEYSREPRQASSAVVEIARQVAERLRLEIPPGDRWTRAERRQIDPGAYDLYLQARHAARRDRSRAIVLFRQAIDMDPKLTEARVGLSEALYFEVLDAGGGADPRAIDHAREEAEGALAVEADSPGVHIAVALSASTTGAAASSLARALALDPSSAEAWHYAGDLVLEGDPALASGYYERALQLDPGLDMSRLALAAAREMLDRLPEAETEIGLGQSARPDRPWWKQMRARVEIARRNYDGAVEMLAGEPTTEAAPFVWLLGRVSSLAMSSRVDVAKGEAVRLTERYPGFCEGQAMLGALEWDSEGKARGRSMADAIFARADLPDAPPSLLPCAAIASAGIGDGPRAAGYIAKLAASERALRAWLRPGIFGSAFAFRRQLYPWNKIDSSYPFKQARAALTQSLARLRDDTVRHLPTPPAQVGQ